MTSPAAPPLQSPSAEPPFDPAPLVDLPPLVVVHGAASPAVTVALWDAGLRPLPATTGPTVWVASPGRP